MTGEPTAQAVIDALAARGETVATAESLTGGMVADAFVSVPGTSVVYRGGVIPYATPLKHELLGVDADLRSIERQLVSADALLQPLQPLVHDLARNLVLHHCRRSPRPGAILERISRGVAHFVDDAQRRLEVLLGLAGEADDEVAGEGNVGAGSAHLRENSQISFGRMTAVHRLEDAVAA